MTTTYEPNPSYGSLLMSAEYLDSIETIRIATANRVRAATQTADGQLSVLTEVGAWEAQVKTLEELEKFAIKDLERTLKQTPLFDFVKRTTGLGLKQTSRLLAAIGDPATREMPSQLWSYAGYSVWNPGDENFPAGHSRPENHGIAAGGVAPHHVRGQKSNWNSDAKMRVFLIAESCIKNRNSPYRKVYDDTRLKYAEATHANICKRCGPSGKPAQPGSELSDGHKHARAMRAVSKAILLDLWVEARTQAGLPHGRNRFVPTEKRQLAVAA